MKLKNSRRNKRWPLLLLGVGVLSLICGAIAYQFYPNNPSQSDSQPSVNTIDYNQPSSEQKDAGEATKQDKVDQNNPSPSESSAGTSKTNASVTITQADQASDGTIQVRSIIQAIDTSGSCLLQLKKGEAVITKNAPVRQLSTYSTCEGFDVPRSELTTGIWELRLDYTSQSYEGSATIAMTVD